MALCFLPSPSEGYDLDYAVRHAFADSLGWCKETLERETGVELRSSACIKPYLPQVRPVQFGFYYSLSTALSLWESQDIQAQVNELEACWYGILGQFSLNTAMLSESLVDGVATIRITQLAEPFYSSREIACIKKWLDMEPENAIDLAPLESHEFTLASAGLCRALNLIETGLPDFYQEMQASTREIILAKPSGAQKMTFGGVSSFALWGALCLNVEAHQDWRDYIPSLIHEYSHNILFAKALQGPLVTNDPGIRYFSPLRGTMRPMDGIYHAAFVSAREVYAVDSLLKQTDLLEDDDLIAYLNKVKVSSYQAYQDCLISLDADGELTDLGRAIIEDTKAVMCGMPITLSH